MSSFVKVLVLEAGWVFCRINLFLYRNNFICPKMKWISSRQKHILCKKLSTHIVWSETGALVLLSGLVKTRYWLTAVCSPMCVLMCMCVHFPLHLKVGGVHFLLGKHFNWNSKSLSWCLNKTVLFNLLSVIDKVANSIYRVIIFNSFLTPNNIILSSSQVDFQ